MAKSSKKSSNNGSISLEMVQEKICGRSVKYTCDEEGASENIYIRKDLLEEQFGENYPKKLTISISK